jgi:enoyl-CoA hydratase/carnithine racemase
MKTMRSHTLGELLGEEFDSILKIFKKGRLPLDKDEMIDKVFGPPGDRGCMMISGGNGTVGAGKAVQFRIRLPLDIPILILDMPNTPDGVGKLYSGLKKTFGEKADDFMANIFRFTYDGKKLPEGIKKFNPKFVLECIPEDLDKKTDHYEMLWQEFPGIEIRSVTSGFPSSELGVGILHPAFPHNTNKIWEVVEDKPSDITKLLWALGMIPVPVGDYWSFVLDVLFCGLMNAACDVHERTNLSFVKIDKLIRKYVGPNPSLAHDAIGPIASVLTHSCLYHLSIREEYGRLFTPAPDLVRRKDSQETWYPKGRPSTGGDLKDEEEFIALIFGPLFQMASIMLHEKRASIPLMNFMGESCALFRKGINVLVREFGADKIISIVEKYHEELNPEAAKSPWYPEVFDDMDLHEWKQIYVNAEYCFESRVGVITISRERINNDLIEELINAVGWLKAEGCEKVIVTGDFHLSTQMIGADTSEFYLCLEDSDKAYETSRKWSEAARLLHDKFEVSVGFINGKRCLGGMLELMTHCHYVVSVEGAELGFPEVTLPVVPGMEGCHWPFRKTSSDHYKSLVGLLITGKPVKAKFAAGWLIDYAVPMEDALKKVWEIASGDHDLPFTEIDELPIGELDIQVVGDDTPAKKEACEAIVNCINASCNTSLDKALEVQAKHSADFMTSKACKKGDVGKEAKKVMDV